MVKTIKDHLVETLDDLGSENLKKFKNKLCDRKVEPRVRRGNVEKLESSMELADLIINTFTTKNAVQVTVEVLTAIGCNQNAEELKRNTGSGESQRACFRFRFEGSPAGQPQIRDDTVPAAQPQVQASTLPAAQPQVQASTVPAAQRSRGHDQPDTSLALVPSSLQFKQIQGGIITRTARQIIANPMHTASHGIAQSQVHRAVDFPQRKGRGDIEQPDQLILQVPGSVYSVLDKGARKRLALLINNVEFDEKDMKRNGAQRDQENMEKLLRGLGYDVVNHTNLSGKVRLQIRPPTNLIRHAECRTDLKACRSVWDLLVGSLEDLTAEQFKRFTQKLIDSRLEPRVRRGAVEGRDRGDVARKLIETYTETRALGIAVDLLKGIGCNQTAKDLEKEAAAPGPEEPRHTAPEEPRQAPPEEPRQSTPAAPPSVQPDTDSPLILCSPQFREEVLREKGQEIYSVLDKGARKRLALLINNVEFDREDMKRNGAQRDEENMGTLLRGLGYDVVKHTNLSGKEMDEAIGSFAKRAEHADSDSTFVVIMSHGKRDAILGVHHSPSNPADFLPVDRIYHHLNSANCPALINKPKVILIQACRGEEQGRVWVSDSGSDDLWNLESDSGWEHKEKDFVSLLSCTPDTVSYRHRENGALFIGYLVEVFNGHAHKDDIEELFRKASYEALREFTEAQADGLQGPKLSPKAVLPVPRVLRRPLCPAPVTLCSV
ncbi:hypothetical protein NFI96_027793 [Prochilodus magdalenae]|nr:hypothetical protein NFI96_027793 [Prochilodus magdalenae]